MVNPITANNFAVLVNCMPVGRSPNINLTILLVGARPLSVFLTHRDSTGSLLLLQCFSEVVLLTLKRSPGVSTRSYCRFLIIASSVFSLILNVACDDTLMSCETSRRAEQPTKLCKPQLKIGVRLTYRKTGLKPPTIITGSPNVAFSLLFHFL